MSARRDVVFLLDVDNTLLDNDAVVQDFRAYLVRESGPEAAEHYWTLFEELRRELGYADYLGALQPPADSSIAAIGPHTARRASPPSNAAECTSCIARP